MMNMPMTDIHTHILPFVDDGSDSIADSLRMVGEAMANGVKNIILTPHALRTGMPKFTKEDHCRHFSEFQTEARKHFDVNLYLGQEIAYHPQIIKYLQDNKLLTLNDSSYILLELPFFDPIEDYEELFYSFSVLKYNVIIAHIERYYYLSYGDIVSLKRYPVLYQINSNSLTGESGRYLRKRSMKMLKDGLVDFIGSDIHVSRKNDFHLAYQMVARYLSVADADRIFVENPKRHLNVA